MAITGDDIKIGTHTFIAKDINELNTFLTDINNALSQIAIKTFILKSVQPIPGRTGSVSLKFDGESKTTGTTFANVNTDDRTLKGTFTLPATTFLVVYSIMEDV